MIAVTRTALSLRLMLLAALMFWSAARGSQAAELFFDFSKSKEIPAGFLSTVSGEGKPGLWKVVDDEVSSSIPSITPNAGTQKQPVLAQLSRDLTDEHYPILVYTNEIYGDFKFTTRVKCVGGVVEQMAGIVFRYQDENNYYYLRASAKGNTFRFFKVVGGQRSPPIGPEMQIPAGVWHELSVETKGNEIKCCLNGKQEIPTLTDSSFTAGFIGFWTKSDSVSHFADAQIRFTPREPFIRQLLRQIVKTYPRVEALKVYAKTADNPALRIMASTDEHELGNIASEVEPQVIEKDAPFYVEMKSFLGQTERNALARALPIAKDMERGFVEAKDLF
jgi:hypothetical protein